MGNRRIGQMPMVWRLVVVGITLLAAGAAGATASGPGDQIYAAAARPGGNLWTVGAYGVILHSGDGGRSWKRQRSPTTELLFGVDFADDEHGCAVGRAGLVLCTTDGGHTWTRVQGGTAKHLFAVDFADTQFGCAVGDWGAVVATRDGGKTWHSHDLSEDVVLNDIVLLDPARGWAVGEAGALFFTEDACATWTRRRTVVDKTLFAVSFTDPDHGWATGIDAVILTTADGGMTWKLAHGSARSSGLDQVGFSQAFENPSLYGISVSGERGIAVGDMGAVFTSSDGGRTWKRRRVSAAWGLRWFAGLAVAPDGEGVVAGADGWRIPIHGGRIDMRETGNDAATPIR